MLQYLKPHFHRWWSANLMPACEVKHCRMLSVLKRMDRTPHNAHQPELKAMIQSLIWSLYRYTHICSDQGDFPARKVVIRVHWKCWRRNFVSRVIEQAYTNTFPTWPLKVCEGGYCNPVRSQIVSMNVSLIFSTIMERQRLLKFAKDWLSRSAISFTHQA